MSHWFSWNNKASAPTELPDLFPLSIKESEFVRTDVVNIYAKILTDVLERTQGVKAEDLPLFWDNCVQSNVQKGLISLLADAMASKSDLFLVHAKEQKVVRKATSNETQQIKDDYKKTGESKVGIFISFTHFDRTDMVKLYAALEYCVIASLNKSMNLSKAVQIKISDLRGSVALADKDAAVTQITAMAESLKKGKDVYMDAKDLIELLKPDVSATEKSMDFILSKRAYWLGFPTSYLSGEQTAGIGSTGEADMRAVERGLKGYFFAVMKPAIDALFGVNVTFKSQDFRLVAAGLETLKTFQLIDDSLMSAETKKKIIDRMFDLADDGEANAGA